MVDSVTDICNLSLSHLAIEKEIGDIETDVDEEAKVFNRFYENTRNELLESFPWPWAITTVALALVESDPTEEWAYAYRYPSDCLMFKRIQSGIRNDNIDSRIPYRIAKDASGKLIYSDMENAIGEYIALIEDPSKFPASFVMALSYLLAFYMAPRLTGGDQFKLGDKAYQAYLVKIEEARVNAANEEVPEKTPESELIRSRE